MPIAAPTAVSSIRSVSVSRLNCPISPYISASTAVIQNAISACEIRTRYSARNRQPTSAATVEDRPPAQQRRRVPSRPTTPPTVPRTRCHPAEYVAAAVGAGEDDEGGHGRPVPAGGGDELSDTIDSATATPACSGLAGAQAQAAALGRPGRSVAPVDVGWRRPGVRASGSRWSDGGPAVGPSPSDSLRDGTRPGDPPWRRQPVHGERHPLRALPIPCGLAVSATTALARPVQQRGHHRGGVPVDVAAASARRPSRSARSPPCGPPTVRRAGAWRWRAARRPAHVQHPLPGPVRVRPSDPSAPVPRGQPVERSATSSAVLLSRVRRRRMSCSADSTGRPVRRRPPAVRGRDDKAVDVGAEGAQQPVQRPVVPLGEHVAAQEQRRPSPVTAATSSHGSSADAACRNWVKKYGMNPAMPSAKPRGTEPADVDRGGHGTATNTTSATRRCGASSVPAVTATAAGSDHERGRRPPPRQVAVSFTARLLIIASTAANNSRVTGCPVSALHPGHDPGRETIDAWPIPASRSRSSPGRARQRGAELRPPSVHGRSVVRPCGPASRSGRALRAPRPRIGAGPGLLLPLT